MGDDTRVEMENEGSLEFPATKSVVATVVVGLSLLVPSCIGLLISRAPTALSPFPAVTAIPALFLSSRVVAVALPSLLFFVWNPGLFRGQSRIPKRSRWLLAILSILSVAWFVVGWTYGSQYQGMRYVYEVGIINLVIIAFVGTAVSRYTKDASSFKLNLALHWLLFAWLAWYAFPYLGELP